MSARSAVADWLSGPDAPVPPTITSRWRACSKVSAPDAFEKAQTLTLESILPIQLYCEASKRPAAWPSMGAKGTVKATMAMAEPSLGATVPNQLKAETPLAPTMFCTIALGLPGRCLGR